MTIRTGIDLLEIGRLESMYTRQPRIYMRFLQRVFTPAELELAGGQKDALAGRFAAKEAVSKALGTGIGAVSWQEIEILQAPWGEPILNLHGRAAARAQALGLTEWSVSISDTATHVVAVAVATGNAKAAAP